MSHGSVTQLQSVMSRNCPIGQGGHADIDGDADAVEDVVALGDIDAEVDAEADMDVDAEGVGGTVMGPDIVGEADTVAEADIVGVSVAIIDIVAETDGLIEAVGLTVTNFFLPIFFRHLRYPRLLLFTHRLCTQSSERQSQLPSQCLQFFSKHLLTERLYFFVDFFDTQREFQQLPSSHSLPCVHLWHSEKRRPEKCFLLLLFSLLLMLLLIPASVVQAKTRATNRVDRMI